MKFRHLIFASAVAGGMLISLPSLGADNIAFVNVQEIMRESTAARSAKEQIEAKTKTIQSEMGKKEDELQKEDQDLGKQKSVLSPDMFEKKVKEFRARATAAQKEAQARRLELDNATQSSLTEIQKAVFNIVKKMAEERGYNVVLPTSELLYADEKLDITKEVLSKLNVALPKVTVKFKAPSSKDDE